MKKTNLQVNQMNKVEWDGTSFLDEALVVVKRGVGAKSRKELVHNKVFKRGD